MKFPAPVPIQWIADLIQAKLVGNPEGLTTGINEIHRVEKGDLVFVDHPKYYDRCLKSKADFIIINAETAVPTGKSLLICEQPFEAYLKIAAHFRPFMPSDDAISKDAIIGKDTVIQPGCFVGRNVEIGSGCILHANVTIYDHVRIGNNVVIHSGTVIGSDAFYFNTQKKRDVWYKKMLSCGMVVVEDDVEIGAGCTIDRGVTHTTLIGKGSKLDNQVHIGHDTIIGKNCLLAAQVGIAGAVEIQDGVVLWGQVGVSKTLTIGENAVVLAQSGVPSSLEGNKSYFGTPAIDAAEKRRELVWIKRIPQLWEKVMNR